MKTNFKMKRIMIFVISLCIIMFLLVLMAILNNMNYNQLTYSSLQEQIASSMLYGSKPESDSENDKFEMNIQNTIENNFATSSSMYCFAACDDQIFFLKDQNTTKDYIEEKSLSIDTFLNQKGLRPQKLKSPALNTVKTVLGDNNTYLISMGTISQNGKQYKLGICTRVNYIIMKNKFDIYSLYLITYTALIMIAFISVTFFETQRYKKSVKRLNELEKEVINSRQLVDIQHEKISELTDNQIGIHIYGFFTKGNMEDLLKELTQKQLEASTRVKIRINTPDSFKISCIAALLERFDRNKLVSCLWEEDVFMVLLLNASMKEAEYFSMNLRKQYQLNYGGKNEDLNITIMI